MFCITTAVTFGDHDPGRYAPQSTVETVGVVLCDEPLAAPLVDGGSCDAKLCRNLTCREHATPAKAVIAAR